ncbi:MAG: hypothetical protein DCO96_00960 [Fluviicola sp. XM-24bin1]|nr:MAG: hypothetical protein DCO96_00960 [Fluviicola sp. XM-24bin1]
MDRNSSFDLDFFTFCKVLWIEFFKEPIDEISSYRFEATDVIRARFFDAAWYRIYDFIELIANFEHDEVNFYPEEFIEFTNKVLESENSGYRLLNGQIVPISNEFELSEIDESLIKTQALSSYSGVNLHLNSVIQKLSDRSNPDYRNSIKESILAVESICSILTGDKKATLGVTLKKLETENKIHSALKTGFSALYGYTSDAGGIRHKLLEGDSEVSFDEAKFMLVTCSVFINFLISKASKNEK